MRRAAMLMASGALWPTLAAAQTHVVLRELAPVAWNETVRLGDVATLAGPDASDLLDLILLEPGWAERAARTPIHLDVEHLRAQLADRGVLARVLVRGSTCELVSAADPPRPALTPTDRPARPHAPESITADRVPTGTIAAHVARRLAVELGVAPADLRLTFDPADESLLRQSDAGRTVDVQPLGRSQRMPVRITVYARDRIVASEALRVGVAIRRPVARLRQDVARGEVILSHHVADDVQWLAPGDDALDPALAIGQAARSRLQTDHLLRAGDVQPAIVVRRGELVVVHCLAGTVVVETQARALHDALDGELVELETLEADRARRRRFPARMSGRGHAVIHVDLAATSPSLEPPS